MDPDPNIWWLLKRRLESEDEWEETEEEEPEYIGDWVEVEIVEGEIDSEIDSECEEYCEEEEETEGESDDSEEEEAYGFGSLNSSDIAREQEEYECIGLR